MAFAEHHGYDIVTEYKLSDSAWKAGGGAVYKSAIASALAEAHAGKFKVLIVWALDRIIRDEESGAEAALRLMRQFRQRGVTVVSVKEDWLNGSPEVQDILIAFAGWMAERESARRCERVKNGIARRMAEDPNFRPGRQPGARDKKPRKVSGYYARNGR